MRAAPEDGISSADGGFRVEQKVLVFDLWGASTLRESLVRSLRL